MIALLLKLSGFVTPALEVLKKLPKGVWIAIGIVVVLVLVFGAGWHYRGVQDEEALANARADTSDTITQHTIQPPSTEGYGPAIPPVAFDTAGFEARMQSAYDLEKKALAQTYITEMDSIQGEIVVLRKMNRTLAEEKRFRDSTGQGTLNVSFNPLRDYPRGYFWYKYEPAPFTYYDTTRTITRHVIEPRPLAELFVGGGINSKLSQPFKGLTGWFEPGVQVNMNSTELLFGLGAYFDESPHVIASAGFRHYPFRNQ